VRMRTTSFAPNPSPPAPPRRNPNRNNAKVETHENKGENSRTITQSNWAGDSIEIKITHFPQQGEMLDEHMPEIYQEKWTLDKSGKKLTIEKYGLLQTSTLEFKKQNIVPVGPLPSTSRPVKN